jgi:hypothetical protein
MQEKADTNLKELKEDIKPSQDRRKFKGNEGRNPLHQV